MKEYKTKSEDEDFRDNATKKTEEYATNAEKSAREYSKKIFFRIIHMICDKNYSTSNLSRLLESNLLDNNERKIVDTIFQVKKNTSIVPKYQDLVDMGLVDKDFDFGMPVYFGMSERTSENTANTKNENRKKFVDLDSLIESFIWNREREQLICEVVKSMGKFIKNGIPSEELGTYLNKLANKLYPHNFSDDSVTLNHRLFDFDKGILTGIEVIDNITGGFRRGTLNTIAGDLKSYTLLASNIERLLLLNNINVCHISFGTKSEMVLCRILSTLSKDLIGDNINLFNILKGINHDESAYQQISKIFNLKYKHKIRFIDSNSFNTFDTNNLGRLLFSTNQEFINDTFRPIDVILVEGLEYAKLETKSKLESNINSVANVYLNFFYRYSREHNIAIIIFTNKNGNNFKKIAYSNGFSELSDSFPNIDVLSDNFILCQLVEDNKLQFQITKAINGFPMEEIDFIEFNKSIETQKIN